MNGDDDEIDDTEQPDVGSESAVGVMPLAPSAPLVSAPPTPAPAPPAAAPPASPYDEIQRRFQMQDLRVRQSQARAEESQWINHLVQSARVQDAGKAVEMALKFQALRGFGREVERGLAEGLDRNSASARAAATYPLALGGGAAAASFIKATAPTPPPQLQTFQTPMGAASGVLYGGKYHPVTRSQVPQSGEYSFMTLPNGQQALKTPKGTVHILKDPAAEARMRVAVAELNTYNARRADAVTYGMPAADVKRLDDAIESKRKALENLFAPAAAPAAALAAGGAPGPDYTFNSEADARAAGNGAGSVVRIKGVGRVRLK